MKPNVHVEGHTYTYQTPIEAASYMSIMAPSDVLYFLHVAMSAPLQSCLTAAAGLAFEQGTLLASCIMTHDMLIRQTAQNLAWEVGWQSQQDEMLKMPA